MTPDEEKEFRDTQKLAINLAKWLDGVIRGEHGALPIAVDSLRNCGVDKVRVDYLKYMRDRADAAALTWQKKIDSLVEFSNKAKALGLESPNEVIRMIGVAVHNRDGLQGLHEDQLMEAVAFVIAEGSGCRVCAYGNSTYATEKKPPQ
jgi:hypothetical protein